MNPEIIIRETLPDDKPVFVEMTLKLARYNREYHNQACRYDDFNKVLDAIKNKAEKTFTRQNDDVLILVAVLNNKPAGYALGRIYTEEETADNGTGRIGLFDELFVDKTARGMGIGQMLTESLIRWMKSKKIYRIKLHAYAWNKAAQKLYERNGFAAYATSFEKII